MGLAKQTPVPVKLSFLMRDQRNGALLGIDQDGAVVVLSSFGWQQYCTMNRTEDYVKSTTV